jgi:hypothetical protein
MTFLLNAISRRALSLPHARLHRDLLGTHPSRVCHPREQIPPGGERLAHHVPTAHHHVEHVVDDRRGGRAVLQRTERGPSGALERDHLAVDHGLVRQGPRGLSRSPDTSG